MHKEHAINVIPDLSSMTTLATANFSKPLGTLKSYIRWHLIALWTLTDSLMLFCGDDIYCRLHNMKALAGKILRGGAGGLRVDKALGTYVASSSDGSYEIHFCQKARASFYYFGVDYRGLQLGQDYCLDLVDFKPGDRVVDCGANVGEFYYYFKAKNLAVDYLGFEPAPVEFACLKQNVGEQQARNMGLWHENGELKFYVAVRGANSSFIEPPEYESVTHVPTARLDSLVHEPIKLLKVEAEGAEPEVLQGCEGILHQIHYISADVSFERGLNQDSTIAPVTNFLLAHNFELVCVGKRRRVALYRNKAFAS